MLNLHVIVNDIFVSDSNLTLLTILETLSVILALLVIIIKNPIQSVIFLIGLFSTISIYLISIGASFIGLSYLLVYVGAVSILFLFILMLINIRTSELLSDTRNSLGLVLLVSAVFGNSMYNLSRKIISIPNISTKFPFTYVKHTEWDNSIVESSHITSIGNLMYTSYLMWLLITSLILLLAMVGAIVITLKAKDLNKKDIQGISNPIL